MHFALAPKSGPPHYDAGMTLRAKLGLVLVPGLLCDELMWRPQLAALAAVAECWVADHTRSETMAEIAADVLRDAPFETFALARLSIGGYVALALMPLALHEEMAANISGSKLEVVEECGHLSTMERPAETSAALARWLEP